MIRVLGQTPAKRALSAVRRDSSLAKFFSQGDKGHGYCSASGVCVTYYVQS
jgi:hypothetical protein